MDRSPGVEGRWSANAGLAPSEMGLPFSVESSVRDKLCGLAESVKKVSERRMTRTDVLLVPSGSVRLIVDLFNF